MLTKNDLSQIRTVIRDEIGGLKSDVSTLKSDVTGLKKDMAKANKKLDVVIDFFDTENLELKTRVKRIENHLGFPATL